MATGKGTAMSGSEADKVRARQDKALRAEARRQRMARQEEREAAAQAAIRAEQERLVADAKAAREAGVMPAPGKAVKRAPAAKPGMAPVLGERMVDDPLEPGAKLRAIVNLAEHPLEMMLSRRRLDQPLYEAGVRFRRIYEAAEIGPGRGIDPAHIKVDGGRLGDPLSDSVVHAQFELKRLALQLGPIGERIVSAVAGRGMTVSDLAERWPGPEATRQKLDYLTMRLREALDLLATEVWGAKGPERARITGMRAETVIYDEQAVAVANQTYLRKRGISL
jgi:hypothetical protein